MSEHNDESPKLGFKVKMEGSLLDINLRISGKWVLIIIAASLGFLIPGSKELLIAILSFIQ